MGGCREGGARQRCVILCEYVSVRMCVNLLSAVFMWFQLSCRHLLCMCSRVTCEPPARAQSAKLVSHLHLDLPPSFIVAEHVVELLVTLEDLLPPRWSGVAALYGTAAGQHIRHDVNVRVAAGACMV